MNREAVINQLTDELIQYIKQEMLDGNVEVLESYIRTGFTGFEKMSFEDLNIEYECVFGEQLSEVQP